MEETREKKLGNIYGFSGGNFSGNVYDENQLCPAFSTMGGGNRQPMIVAMRGRPDGCGNSQRLEPCERDMTNTITTVQKDNLLVENVGNLNPSGRGQNGNVVNSTGLARAITIEKGEGQKICTPEYRIRKLTPRECWRLMGYTDEDFDRASAVVSNTQLYKQAGNAIVKQVLMALFRQMNIKNCSRTDNKTAKDRQ